jgi:hypothetical protein
MTEEPNRTRGIRAEMLVGVSAVVIGVCALGVSLYEASLMREQQRAAVLPNQLKNMKLRARPVFVRRDM